MRIDKEGKVKKPFEYKHWYAEMTGNTDDTGGFYVILCKNRESKHELLFWDVTTEGIDSQLEEKGIDIEWHF